MSSFFVPDGPGFRATELTRGPWHPGLQHGGPPIALLARAVERLPAGEPHRIVRLTVDLLRPVPIGPVAVEATVLREGRAAQVCEARLVAGDKVALHATALRMRETPLVLPATGDAGPGLRHPDECPAFEFPFFTTDRGYHTAMELRVARGTFGEGAMAVWMRPRVPLLPDEAPSAFQRVALAADSGNGVSLLLDVRRFTFVNPDLTVALHRQHSGEWVGVDARTVAHPTGVGVAEAVLHDVRGPIGRGTQNLLVQSRG